MDIEQIVRIADLALTIAFWSILGLLVVYFFIGLIRGWKMGTFRTIFMLIILVTLLALLPVWIDIIGNLNLASMGVPAVTISMRGQSVTVVPTTVFGTIRDATFAVLKDIFHVKSSVEQIATFATAFAASAIRLVLVAAAGLLTYTVGALLAFIFWHALFKHFIPKPKRKPKLRIISALEELVVGVLCVVVMVAPLSSIVNAFHNYVDSSKLPDKYETVQLYKRLSDTYDKSILNQAFFAWTKGSGKSTIDVQLGEFIAASQVGDATANLITEIRTLGNTGGQLLSLLADTNIPGDITTATMFTPISFAGRTLAAVLTLSGEEGANVLSDLSTFAVDISSRYDQVAATLGQETISRLSSPKKRASYLSEGEEAYRRLAAAGVFETEIDPLVSLSALPVYDDPYIALTSNATLQALEEVSNNPRESAVVEAVLHGYLSNRANATGVKALMPIKDNGDVASEEFASYSYLEEAKTIVKTFNRINDLEPSFAKKVVTNIKYAASTETIVNDALAAFAKHGDAFLNIIVGPRDDKGEPVTVGGGGLSADGCLLDSGLVNAIFPAALEIGTAYLEEGVLETSGTLDISPIAIELQGKNTAENIINDKREFGHILDTVGKMIQNPYAGSTDQAKITEGEAIAQAAKDLLADFKSHKGIELDPEGNLYSYLPALFQAIAYGISQLDSSKVLSFLMPPVAKKMLLKADSALHNFDITTLDASPTDEQGNSIIGQEIAHFLAIGFRCANIFPIFTRMGSYSVNSIATAVTKHADEFEKILDIVASSKILNPNFRSDGAGGYVLADNDPTSEEPIIHNLNFVKVLNYLFKSFEIKNVLSDTALTDPSVVKLSNEYEEAANVVDYMATKTKDNENHALIEAISTVMVSGVLDALEDMASSKKIIQNLANVDIRNIFGAIGDSYVLRQVVPGYFDDVMLKPIFNPAGGEGVDLDKYHISFTNIGPTKEDWTQEGSYFQTLIDLAANGIDLAHFDFFQDGEALMEIMSALSQSNMFAPYKVEGGEVVTDGEGNPVRDYTFPSFFADKLLASAGENTKYFENENATGTEREERCSSFVAACKKLDTPAKWKIEENGEFAKLKQVFFDLSKVGSFESLSTFDGKTIPTLKMVLRDVASTDTFSTVFLGNAINEAMNKINAGEISFSAAYTRYFYDESRDAPSYDRAAKAVEMQGEVDDLFAIMQIVYDEQYGIANGSTISMDNVKLNKISADYFVDPMLTSAHNSVVFHPTEGILTHEEMEAYRAEHPYTLFEQLMGQFIMKSGVYKTAPSTTWESPLSLSGYPSEKTIAGIVTGVGEAEWDNEIDSLCGAIKKLQSAGLIDSSGNVDFSAISDLGTFFGKTENKRNERTAWLHAFLNDIDSSALLRRALPKMLDDTVKGLSLATADIVNDIKCSNFYFMNDGGDDYGPLGDGEIGILTNIFKQLSGCTNINPEDFSTLNGTALASALNLMETSKIFHSNTAKANEIFAVDSPKRDHTAFENLLGDIISNKALSSYLYYDGSPKDIYYKANSAYQDSLSKALFLVRQNCAAPIGSTPNGQSGEVEINKLGDFLNSLSSESLKPFMSGGTPNFDGMDTSTLAGVLASLNDSAFLCDLVPSALDQTVNKTASSFSVDGIDLKAADFYYMYDEIVTSDPDVRYKAKYEQSEIDQICFIMDTLKQNKDVMASLKVSSIDPMMLRFLLLDLSNSKVFHMGGLPNESIYPRTGWSYEGGKLVENNDLTVFEQFIKKIYVESGLYSQNFSLRQSEEDLQLYLDRGEGGRLAFLGSLSDHDEIVKVASRYKLHQNIILFSSSQDTKNFPVLKGGNIQTSWLNEISALTSDGHYHDPKITDTPHGSELDHQTDAFVGLIQIIQSSSFVTGDSTVEFSTEKLNATEPNQIYYLFNALNECTIIHEALPNAFASFVSGKGGGGSSVGVNTFSNDAVTVVGPVNSVTFDSEVNASKTMYKGEELVRKAMADKVTFTYSGSTSASDAVSSFASHFRLTYNSKDVTSLASGSADGTTITIDVSQIPGTFTLESLGDGQMSAIRITFDRADYRLNQDEYGNTAIPSVYYFFASAFRGQKYSDSYYYSFSGGSTAMGDFLNDPGSKPGFKHSTFGLFYLLNGSGLFNNVATVSGQTFSAKDFALYGLLNVKSTIYNPLTSSEEVFELKMGSEFHPTLGQTDIYESSAGIHDITKDYQTENEILQFCFEEAAYLDQYIDALGYADILVNKVYWDMLYKGSGLPTAKLMLMNVFESYSFADTSSELMPYQKMIKFAGSAEYDAPFAITLYGTLEGAGNPNFISTSLSYSTPGKLCQKLISSIVRKYAISYNAMAKLDHTGLPTYTLASLAGNYPGTMGSGRGAHMTASGYTDLAAISSAITHENVLAVESGKLGAVKAMGEIVKAIHLLNSPDMDALSSIVAGFANATDGAKILLEQFYMGDLYDYFAGGLTTVAYSSTGKKFIGSTDIYYDFVNDVNKLGGVGGKAFSYSDLATYLAA